MTVAGSSENGLTWEKIMDAKRTIDAAIPQQTFMGFKVVASPYIPDEVPAVQMHPDCDPQGLWCTAEFRAETNQWLLEKLGTKQVAFIMNNQQMIAISQRMMARIDRDIERICMGRGL